MFYRINTDIEGEIKPEHVLYGYTSGIFPMGIENSDTELEWIYANPRGIIPINNPRNKFKISRSLKRTISKNIYEIKINTCFEEVIKQCSLRKPTWINSSIISLYTKLHEMGYAHSFEAYSEGKLAGGLYGVSVKKAFFGESMFTFKTDASKTCVVYLYDFLIENNFKLFDIQMITPLFKSFGAIEIPFEEYSDMLKNAIS